MKDILKIAAVFIGTIVGAGLASGQEILQFFSTYGINGFWGILLCLICYSLLSFILVSLCYRFRFKSYSDIVIFAFGHKIGKLADAVLTFFIFSGNVIMLSGGGAMAREYLGLNRLWGILLMALLAFSVTYFSNKGIIALNSVIVPFSMAFILLIGFLVFKSAFESGTLQLDLTSLPPKQSIDWMFSSVLYAAFNLIAATGVICPLAFSFANRKSFLKGCLLGGAVLSLLAASICYSILYYLPQSLHYEIPNLYIAQQYGGLLPFVLAVVIWLEMFSTEVGSLYSLSSSLQSSMKISNTKALLLILLFSVPFTFIGFSNLIKVLYPAYGVLGVLFIFSCTFKYIKTK